VRIASVNCRGLGDVNKRRDVFHYLREKNFSIYLLQDTHFSPSMEQCIKNEWGYDSLFASFNTNSRGVAILFKNNFEYKLIKVVKDINGNWIFAHVKINDKDFLIVSVYGPNDDNPIFYVDLEECVKKNWRN